MFVLTVFWTYKKFVSGALTQFFSDQITFGRKENSVGLGGGMGWER
jgi:hypothetical protein